MSKENKEKELKETVKEEGVQEEVITESAQECPEEKTDYEKKISDLEAKIAKEKDDYLRLMAEFDNFRRRTSQEKLELVSMASMDTIKGLLPVLTASVQLPSSRNRLTARPQKRERNLYTESSPATSIARALRPLRRSGNLLTRTSTKLWPSSRSKKKTRRERSSM